MAGLLFIKIDMQRPEWLSDRAMRHCLMVAHKVMPFFWHQNYARKHFEQPSAGGGRYGYSFRGDAYVRGKKDSRNIRRHRIRDSGQYALVYTGATREAVVNTRGCVRAWPNRSFLAMLVPRYIHMSQHLGRGGTLALGDEIVRQSPNEEDATRTHSMKTLVREIEAQRPKGRKTVQV